MQDRLRPILPKPQDSRLDRQLLAALDRKVRRRLETDGSEPGAVVVNPHVDGQPASLNPAFRLRQVSSGVLTSAGADVVLDDLTRPELLVTAVASLLSYS